MAIKGFGRNVHSVRAFGRGLSGSSSPTLPARVPAIGLALGGGFARGIVHVGVLKVFEQEQIPIACIAGTSVGALIGAAYCSGMSPAELEVLATRVRMRDLARWTISRLGFATNLRMITFLNKILKVKPLKSYIFRWLSPPPTSLRARAWFSAPARSRVRFAPAAPIPECFCP